jgi:transposase
LPLSGTLASVDVSDLRITGTVGGEAKATLYAKVLVTLSKQEHIELVWAANYWKVEHRRAAERTQSREAGYEERLRQAAQREAQLGAELEVAQAKIRDLQQRLFGRKSERRKGGSEQQARALVSRVPRGHQRGAPSHGRAMQSHLPERIEFVDLGTAQCPRCGLALGIFPGSEDSEVLEIEVQAYRRVIRRRRYRPLCDCGCLPGIVTAPPPPRLIERGKYGLSVWIGVLLDKFLYGRPSHRLLQDLADRGLNMSAGTLAGGLQALAPLFAPLDQALVHQLRSEAHWHADETRWAVFIELAGKIGHRWYLWVFHSRSVVHYVLDSSRSAAVVESELVGVQRGFLSCDRYVAYKKFARLHPGVVLAFCWAHQRRDFLELANDYPEVSPWAMGWVDAIAELYHLNGLRLQASAGSAERAAHHADLQQAVQRMATQREAALADPVLAEPAAKVLQSMTVHWPGLTVFVDHPGVPMDNNVAERDARLAVVGRKNFYGSGSEWSGQLAATMYSLLMTVKLWQINARTWLSAYLQACADNGNRAPPDLNAFLPWTMDTARLAAMRACPSGARPVTEGIDSS